MNWLPSALDMAEAERDRKSKSLNYTLSLHDALPISFSKNPAHHGESKQRSRYFRLKCRNELAPFGFGHGRSRTRSEEQKSELHSLPPRRSSDLLLQNPRPSRRIQATVALFPLEMPK